jgi:tetratricopeptide (TPR) repeat protein
MVALDSGVHQMREQQNEDDAIMVDALGATTAPSNRPNHDPAASSSSPEVVAQQFKEKGNAYFSAKKLPEAAEAYQKALRALEEGGALPSSSSSCASLAILLRSNLALVLLKMRNFQQAEQETCKCLEMDPDNVKGTKVQERTSLSAIYSMHVSHLILSLIPYFYLQRCIAVRLLERDSTSKASMQMLLMGVLA